MLDKLPPYSQISQPASWALFTVTLLVSGFVFFMVGFVSIFLAILQQFFVPEKLIRFDRALWLGVAVILPAIYLLRFYFVTASRKYLPRHAIFGWTVSVGYHAALTWALVFYMPGAWEISGGQTKFPLSYFSGAALCLSFYLLVRCPRLPKLPANAPNSSIR